MNRLVRSFSSLLLIALSLTIVANPPATAESVDSALFVKGKELLKQKRPKEALHYFDISLKQNPEYIPSLLERAKIYVLLQQHEEAIKDCKKILSLDQPDKSKHLAKTHKVLAECYTETGRYKDGEREIDIALKLDPTNHKYALYRAEIRKELRDTKGAIEDFGMAIKHKPDESPSEYFERGKLYASTGRLKDAVNDFTIAIKQTDKKERILVSRADAYLKLNQYEKAVADCSEVLTHSNKGGRSNFAALKVRAAAYAKLGKKDLAKVDENAMRKVDDFEI